MLAPIGEASGASRIYLFESHRAPTGELLASQRAEWCAPGVKPEIDNPELQNLAMEQFFPRWVRLLSAGGYLVTCSCSYNVNEAMFEDMLHQSSIDSHTPMAIVEKRMQGRDHPVLIGVPETHYLKCFILRKIA